MVRSIDDRLATTAQWLKENTRRWAFRRLRKDVVDTGVCVECGTCVGVCPEQVLSLSYSNGRLVPVLEGKCKSCGLCYEFCPRTPYGAVNLIGQYISVWRACSSDRHRGQNGGVVTAILSTLLETGRVEAVVAVGPTDEDRWSPEAKVVSSPAEARRSGGTIYSHAPVVATLLDALKAGHRRVAVVGTPCDIDALAGLARHPAGPLSEDENDGVTVLRMGLFCMESFNREGLAQFLTDHGVDVKNVSKMEISSGVFRVTTNAGTQEWPVTDLDGVVSSSCHYCTDLTAVNSDISCGNIGTDDEWTTVIVRTEEGKAAFELARERGAIEAEPLDEKAVRKVMGVARFKATRPYVQRDS